MGLDCNVNDLRMFYVFNKRYYTKVVLTVKLGCIKFAFYIVSFYVLFVFNRLGMTASQAVNAFWHN